MRGRHRSAVDGREPQEIAQFESHRDTTEAGRQVGRQVTCPLADPSIIPNVAYLLRTPVAVAIACITAFVAFVEILGIRDLFTLALLTWALCLVLATRAAMQRRRGATIAYVLGALPATLALGALLWVTSQ
jgi:hypothetical protein